MKNKSKKQSTRALLIKALAIVLAALMVGGAATIIISILTSAPM